jgi:CRISPR-associated protein Csy1
LAGALELGTQNLAGDRTPDVVGNAAALDVYKFLRLTVDDRSLLERAIARDPAFADALSEYSTQAAEWMATFAALPDPKGKPASHKLAKQIYWPLGNGTYHLLAPLLSSSLAHAVHKRISEDRFSEAAKAAREAKRKGENHPQGYRDYPNLAIQSFGGSKPQNISQLNSERRGQNYLLASLPPIWRSAAIRPPLKTETVFARYFERRRKVQRLVEALKKFLRRVADAKNNERIRAMRHQLMADLCDQVLQMAAELRELEPCWSAGMECRLNLAEQCWLDPERYLTDEEFAICYRRGDWKDEVCLRFANWLNGRLKTDKTLFGGSEALEWKGMLEQELKLLREEVGDE